MSSLFSHRTHMENGEEEMLMAEDCRPDLIHSQDFRRQCRSSLGYYHCKEEEREHLIAHESLDYLPSHSSVYKKWLQEKTYRKEGDRWLLMGLIGTAVGMLGFLIHKIIDSLIKLKWDLVENYLQDGNIHMTWLRVLGSGMAMVVLSSGSVLFFCPAGSPSGLPEIIGYLNGTSIQHLFNIKTFLGTFISCMLAVASGLFCGQGPMIRLGALLGCGLSQLQSDTLGIHLPIFTRFRNSADKCSFITAGTGAGMALVFRAPNSGLLFTLEKVPSFWDIRPAWQTFCCCLMTTFTTDLLSSSLYGFVYRGHFGFFEAEKRIIFWVKNLLDTNVLAFVPTISLGMLGGLLGALFVSLNIKINKLRMQFFNSIPKLSLRKTSNLETVLILICTTTVTVYLAYFFPCTPVMSVRNYQLRNNSGIKNQFKREISEYSCSSSTWIGPDGVRYSNQTFNQAAALLVENGKQGITHLFKHGTHEEFGYTSLCTALAFYFILSCWTAGSAVASGLVIPMLYTGALYGRIIGLILVSIFGVQTNEYGAWIDPGLFAAIGAASFFSGVSRLTICLTVIMVEISNDVQSLLLIMLAVMVAKIVGDLFNASLYSSLLKLKCISYLDVEPFVRHRRKWFNLELFSARDVMEPGVRVLHLKENIASLAQLPASTSHGGFPVVCRPKPDHAEVFQGTIKRLELCMLLENEHTSEPETNDESFSSSHPLSYEKITVEKLPNLSRLTMLLNRYTTDPRYQQLFINLEPYINKSAMLVQAHFLLQRTYIIFRTLGLRHLPVVDPQNRVIGVITRKDLMPFPLEERLRLQLAPQSPDAGDQPLDSRLWMRSEALLLLSEPMFFFRKK
ncbi:LOW QUALITY PROTEIN: chloride channel protein C-like [Morus bassanus]